MNILIFAEELERPLSTSSFEPDIKARKLYALCIDEKAVNDLGLSEGKVQKI